MSRLERNEDIGTVIDPTAQVDIAETFGGFVQAPAHSDPPLMMESRAAEKAARMSVSARPSAVVTR